jgi:hypothetical protein
MDKIAEITFQDFINAFPETELPIDLTEDTQSVFSKENRPLSKQMIEEYIVPIDDSIDEFTEYIPCFRIPRTKDFHAIVLWKAGLMNYEYFVLTFDKKGSLIEKKMIAGTQVKGDALLRTVTTIKKDWTIASVVGVVAANDDLAYDPATSLDSILELTPEGRISNLT